MIENPAVDVDEIEEMIAEIRPLAGEGKLADYIPALQQADPYKLSCSLYTSDGGCLSFGDRGTVFTIQSVSKVITLALAVIDVGEETVFTKVGMEPTGDPFYSIARLELTEHSKPLNPMINAGALTVTSMIKGNTAEEKFERLLDFVKKLTANDTITYDEEVAQSELETADRNRALCYFLKGENIIAGDVDELLSVYTKQCALAMTSCDLSRIGYIFGNEGRAPEHNEQIVPPHIARLVKTFMVTCGMYNASGELAIKVGVPAKSGVSGAILASVPGGMGIGIYSPSLDDKGNSTAGIALLKRLSEQFHLSIF